MGQKILRSGRSSELMNVQWLSMRQLKSSIYSLLQVSYYPERYFEVKMYLYIY